PVQLKLGFAHTQDICCQLLGTTFLRFFRVIALKKLLWCPLNVINMPLAIHEMQVRLLDTADRTGMVVNGTGKWITVTVGKLGNKVFSQLNPLFFIQLFWKGNDKTRTSSAVAPFINIGGLPKLRRFAFCKTR